MWHGWADQPIHPQRTIDYDKRVSDLLAPVRTDSFLRFFLAPGVAPCGGGNGPQPTGRLQAVVDWVEHGKAPDCLLASRTDAGVTRTARRASSASATSELNRCQTPSRIGDGV